MRHLIAVLLAVFMSCATASAAERILLAPAGLQATVAATPSAAIGLQKLRLAAARSGKVRVIIGLRVPFAAEGNLSAPARQAQRNDITSVASGLRARFASAVKRDPDTVRSYSALPFLAMEVTPQELDKLASDPDVITLSPDRPNSANLAESAPLIRAPQAWNSGFTGQGQTIAIIDTGVDKAHPFLAGKVVAEACYSRRYCPGRLSTSTSPGSGVPCANRNGCKHGTHVAGIAAGKGANFSGIARDATLISIQVFSSYGRTVTAWDSDILAALDHVYELHNDFHIAAVNLSLAGSDEYDGDCDAADPEYAAAFATLKSVGIAAVVASGNDGWTEGLPSPACHSDAVSVGAVSDSNWGACWGDTTAVDKVTCYSNTASNISLLAPGSAITSSVPGGRYETWHGTSMAAPHVSGAFAVLKQKMPDATADQLLAALSTSPVRITDSRNPTITKPRIDVASALDRFVTITFTRSAGLGTVDIAQAGGSTTRCFATCTISMPIGSTVTLSAQPASGSRFVGWTGDCAGSSSTCDLTLNASIALAAAFAGPTAELRYVPTGGGYGTVNIVTTADRVTCEVPCEVTVAPATLVTATARPPFEMRFAGWAGPCTGTDACSFQMPNVFANLTASFIRVHSLTFTKAGRGTGSVTFASSGGQTSCTSSCSQTYDHDTVVTLTAQPGPRAKFKGWSGACRGTATCVITMSQAQSATANFSGR